MTKNMTWASNSIPQAHDTWSSNLNIHICIHICIYILYTHIYLLLVFHQFKAYGSGCRSAAVRLVVHVSNWFSYYWFVQICPGTVPAKITAWVMVWFHSVGKKCFYGWTYYQQLCCWSQRPNWAIPCISIRMSFQEDQIWLLLCIICN